jgi:hypothetical protein
LDIPSGVRLSIGPGGKNSKGSWVYAISITYMDSYSTDSGNGQDRVLRMKRINNRVELLVGKC